MVPNVIWNGRPLRVGLQGKPLLISAAMTEICTPRKWCSTKTATTMNNFNAETGFNLIYILNY